MLIAALLLSLVVMRKGQWSKLCASDEVPRVEEWKAGSESTVEVFNAVRLVGEIMLLSKGFQMVASIAMRFKVLEFKD